MCRTVCSTIPGSSPSLFPMASSECPSATSASRPRSESLSSPVRRWQNELRGQVGYDTVMACRSLLHRILQAAEDDHRIDANPVRKVPAPKPPVDPATLLGRAARRSYTPRGVRPAARRRPSVLARSLHLPGRHRAARRGAARPARPSRRSCPAPPGGAGGPLRGRQVWPRLQEPAQERRQHPSCPTRRPGRRRHRPAAPPRLPSKHAGIRRARRRQRHPGRNPNPTVARQPAPRLPHTAVARVADPTATLAYTPRRVLRALREADSGQTPSTLRGQLRGRVPTAHTVYAALCDLEAAGLAVRHAADEGDVPRWSITDPPRDDTLAHLKPRGPHDLRHTFATWLEDAGIPSRVIDELMGHASGQRGRDGSATGPRYRHTTPVMQARAVAAIEERLVFALKVAGFL
jgi:Phage integrase family